MLEVRIKKRIAKLNNIINNTKNKNLFKIHLKMNNNSNNKNIMIRICNNSKIKLILNNINNILRK
jgi:hypothetical protein